MTLTEIMPKYGINTYWDYMSKYGINIYWDCMPKYGINICGGGGGAGIEILTMSPT